MFKKKKSILGDLFKKKDCGCGLKIIPEEANTDLKSVKKENKKK